MFAGTPSLRSYSDTLAQRAVNFVCLGTTGPHTNDLPKTNCPDGLRAQIVFPSCWNGVDLDNPDHKSHLAYPSGMDNGYCPPTHPKRFITMFAEVLYNVNSFRDMWYDPQRQPFVFSNGDPTGFGYHGDFVNGWDGEVLQRAITRCTDDSGVIERCAEFTLIPDDDMRACKVLPRVDEKVTSGVLPALPGCNPVQSGPQLATSPTSCPVPSYPTEIASSPILPFTDVIGTLGWRYVACGLDGNNLPGRTLSGDASYSRPDSNTVSSCVQFCNDRGFRYAGVEYGKECFCGNSIAPGRLPDAAAGFLGNCNFPCSGDPDQICGGYGQIGIYENCEAVEGGACENMQLREW